MRPRSFRATRTISTMERSGHTGSGTWTAARMKSYPRIADRDDTDPLLHGMFSNFLGSPVPLVLLAVRTGLADRPEAQDADAVDVCVEDVDRRLRAEQLLAHACTDDVELVLLL